MKGTSPHSEWSHIAIEGSTSGFHPGNSKYINVKMVYELEMSL